MPTKVAGGVNWTTPVVDVSVIALAGALPYDAMKNVNVLRPSGEKAVSVNDVVVPSFMLTVSALAVGACSTWLTVTVTVPVTVEFLDEVCNPARGAQDFTFWGDGTTTMDPDFRAIVVRELGSVAAFRERYGFTKPTGAVE